MEQVWNIVYLFAGAIIATSVNYIADYYKNKGKIIIHSNGFEFVAHYDYKQNSKGNFEKIDKISHYSFYSNVEFVNTSFEQKILRNLKLEVELADKSKIEEISIFKAKKNKTLDDLNDDILKVLNLSPKSVTEIEITFRLDDLYRNTSTEKVFLNFQNEKNQNKRVLLGQTFVLLKTE